MIRPPNLTPDLIAKAVDLLNSWQGKLTWSRYIAVLQTEIGHLYTKAGLSNHDEIKDAWRCAKDRLKSKKSKSTIGYSNDGALNYALARLEKAQSEIEFLTKQNNRYKAKFKRWAYNAASEGVTEEKLDTPYKIKGA